ncbi:ribonuclease H [Vibrio phage ValKK3]|uniref:Ribonuclease H n=3 Tax=Schizotequatrovirus TaxID=1198137 RepID=A0A140B3G7_9CAUD|nr:ribonuclease H [Vibrio phage VH7D]YP_009201364.1 ribonuclease H [Vibrio phage ValKK3]ALP47017.1 ribonuclease H [Vibrio phage phi-Grn1]QBX06088.1 ribonuclease H [Vibrio phage Va3]QNJ54714.1 ribonuclease H [Vibrio phage vB_ValM_R10Z]QNJ55100.1 ribonuclease H [Vibrio phage vB_ValM_R11Z]URQ03585.1 ribonuclease H [Vibrio phage PVA23]
MSLEGFFKRKTKSFDGMPAGVNLVDFSQIVLSTIMATYKPTDLLTVDLIRHIVLNTLRSNVLKNKLKYPRIILCIDNGKGGYWRKKEAWYYKYKRSEQRDDSGWDFETIFNAMAQIKEEIKENMPYYVMDIEGVEADDHIGVLTNYYVSKNVPVLITSSDGDFTQLHTSKLVRQWSPIQKKWVKPKHGSPEMDIMFKCIKGDKKDGIAPLKAPNDHYTHGDGRRAPSVRKEELRTLMTSTPDELKKLLTEEQFARYEENRKLLDFAFIPKNISDSIIEQFEAQKPAPRSKIMMYFASKKLDKLIESMSEF